MGKNIDKNVSKKLSSKYSPNDLDNAKQYTTDVFKKGNSRNSRSNW